ncbi:Plus-end-directed kinesin ATPase [Bertholletia excelsa]
MGASPRDCSVKVAVHIRPLIGEERVQGCKECVNVVPGKPQVQIGTHSFTFDYVYGGSSSSSSAIFEECIVPLVDGLFQGYNGTVMAYGQTGSGKTYTMGTGFKDDFKMALIPQVMNSLFKRIETLKNQIEFQLRVSFIEILKEEVRDLLDSTSFCKSDGGGGHAGKSKVCGKPPIHIRETSNGAILLAGLTEVDVSTLEDMAACLERGSLNRATGSTNMNSQSSRSHAIFTITLEQMRKIHHPSTSDASLDEDMGEEYLCAKLHLVDLAGSERAKRTGSDGLRLQEGIHINKGLLALGNVISALGDEKRRKEGVYVSYRDSKLTRILQPLKLIDSAVASPACISPADINAEETLNTLKYANRARNIQNKPVVNRDLMLNEIQNMRQQLEYLQAELNACDRKSSSGDLQILMKRIAWLEAINTQLSQELHEYRSKCAAVQESNSNEGFFFLKRDRLKRSLQCMDESGSMTESFGFFKRELNLINVSGDHYIEVDEVTAKEWEHAFLRSSLGKELDELDKHLEQKESEAKLCGGHHAQTLKHHFEKRILELKEDKKTVEQERDCLLAEIKNLAAASDGKMQKVQRAQAQKLKALEAQILDLKKKKEGQLQILNQKQRSDEAAKRLEDEIHTLKVQKVHLQRKIKQEAEQFRQWKASHEKQLLQLRKEGRRNEYEQHKLHVLNQRQKMVLQRKTEEAAVATKRLKELLKVHKPLASQNPEHFNGHIPKGQKNEKALQTRLDHELEVMVNMHAVRSEYHKQRQLQAELTEELTLLKQVDQSPLGALSSPTGNNVYSRILTLSPNARMARITSLENMLSISASTLVAMASQLSEAEKGECGFSSRGHWNQLQSMGNAKGLLQYLFEAIADLRCQLWEKEVEIKEIRDQLSELVTHLQQSEAQRREIMEQKLKEQAVAIALATLASGKCSFKYFASNTCGPSSPVPTPVPKQLKYNPGVANGLVIESVAFRYNSQEMLLVEQLPVQKLVAGARDGKLWKWKRSHHQWLLRFKWKWQKPWKLSEWIRHSDETVLKPRFVMQAS